MSVLDRQTWQWGADVLTLDPARSFTPSSMLDPQWIVRVWSAPGCWLECVRSPASVYHWRAAKGSRVGCGWSDIEAIGNCENTDEAKQETASADH
jgi:hypothetical protein